jgi:hypothetical protein
MGVMAVPGSVMVVMCSQLGAVAWVLGMAELNGGLSDSRQKHGGDL